VLAEDVAAPGVAEALHHLGVADDVGEEDGAQASQRSRGGALAFFLREEGIVRSDEAIQPVLAARCPDAGESCARYARRYVLAALNGDRRTLHVVNDQRGRLDLGQNVCHVHVDQSQDGPGNVLARRRRHHGLAPSVGFLDRAAR
jgi:hypothetical protein